MSFVLLLYGMERLESNARALYMSRSAGRGVYCNCTIGLHIPRIARVVGTSKEAGRFGTRREGRSTGSCTIACERFHVTLVLCITPLLLLRNNNMSEEGGPMEIMHPSPSFMISCNGMKRPQNSKTVVTQFAEVDASHSIHLVLSSVNVPDFDSTCTTSR